MKLAIIGSRTIKNISVDDYIPKDVNEIVSGGAVGIDTLAREYATKKRIKLTEFLPEYHIYSKAAPIKRNEKIAAYADEAIAFWDGKSRGTEYTIRQFQKLKKESCYYRDSSKQ